MKISTMNEIMCPFCNSEQKKLIKKWKYSSVEVSRYQCNCGKPFNSYKGKKSTWTIPKSRHKILETKSKGI